MPSLELLPGQVTEIPLDQLIRDETQPRQTFRDKPLEELAASIKARGILQPITVIPSGAHQFMIKMGERRWRAAKLAGLDTAPCLLDTTASDANDSLLDQLAENDQRESLNVIEHAEALQRLRDRGLSVKAIAELTERHGRAMSRPAVSNRLRLLKLTESARNLVAEGKIAEAHGRELVALADYPEILDKVTEELIEAEEWDVVDLNYVQQFIRSTVEEHGERLTADDACENCACMLTVAAATWKDEKAKVSVCMDPAAIAKKREAAAKNATPDEPAAKKKPETDPTKVKPRKLNPNEDGVVSLKRKSCDTYEWLRSARFDKSQCDGCPHRHLASYNGDSAGASDHCFYVPCFENLTRQQRKIDNREESVRDLIDDQLRPYLLTVCRGDQATDLFIPLVAYALSGYRVESDAPPRAADGLSFDHSASPASYGSGRSSSARLTSFPTSRGAAT